MGAGWYVALDREVAGISGQLPHTGKALLFAQHHLEEMTRASGLPALKAFFSSDPAALSSYLLDQGIAASEEDLAGEEWFDPGDALPTVRHLIDKLHDPPVGLGQVACVRDDLGAMALILAAAVEHGVRFHIATALPDLGDREPPTT